MKAKVFVEQTKEAMENGLNQWFQENPDVEIAQVMQSEGYGGDSETGFSGGITVTILYNEPGKARTW